MSKAKWKDLRSTPPSDTRRYRIAKHTHDGLSAFLPFRATHNTAEIRSTTDQYGLLCQGKDQESAGGPSTSYKIGLHPSSFASQNF